MAKIAFDDIADFDGTIAVPMDLGSDLFPHSYAAGARIYSISWGTTAISYDTMAMEIDKFVYMHDDFTVLVASGNDGPMPWTVASPATAKNIIAVGATERDESVPTFKIEIRVEKTSSASAYLCEISAVANFGPLVRMIPPMTKTVAVASPLNACNPLQSMYGQIALIERGTCTFESKIIHAQNAGALFVIFFNNVDDIIVVMGSENSATQANIPCVLISQTHGAFILKATEIAAMRARKLNITVPIITSVGGENGARHTLADISARGPTNELRIKPDVLCPGIGIYSAHSDGSTTTFNCGMNIGASRASIAIMSGTSMAAPLCAGAAAMVREYFVRGFAASGTANTSVGFAPSAALVKAVLIHSAQPVKIRPSTHSYQSGVRPGTRPSAVYETQYPNMKSGYGQIELSSALQFADSSFQATYFDRQALLNGKRTVFCFRMHNVNPITSSFRVSLVWTDPPGDPTSSQALVNDLDLVVHTPDKTILFGNALSQTDETHGTYSIRDSVNNVEQVRVLSAANGIYSVHVHARDIAIGPQKFALVVSATSILAVLSTSQCAPPTCPDACSGRGNCLGSGICECPLTHGGANCAMPYKTLQLQTQPIALFTTLSVTWLGISYYTFEIANRGTFSLSIVNDSPNVRSDADFYLAKGRLPTKEDFDARIANIFSSGTFQSVGNAGGFWILALLAYEGDVQVLVALTPANNTTAIESVFSDKTVFLHESSSMQNSSTGNLQSQELTCSEACDCKIFTAVTGSLADRVTYDNEYADNLGCWWMIIPDKTDAIQLFLQFGSFVTEKYYNTVTIYECLDTLCRNTSEIEVMSGIDIVVPYTVSTSTGAFLLRFQTDDSASYSGFSATWWTVPLNTSTFDDRGNTTGGAFVTGQSGIIASELNNDIFQNYRWIIGNGTVDTAVFLSYGLSAASAGTISIYQCASLDWSLIENTNASWSPYVPICLGPISLSVGVRNVHDTYSITGVGTMEVVFERNLSQTHNHFEALWNISTINSVIQHTPVPDTPPAISTCNTPLCARFTYETATGTLQIGTQNGTYKANTDYVWTISVDRSKWIRLRFSWFDIEKNYDVVRLYQCIGIETGKQCVDDASWTLFATLSGSLADSAIALSMQDGFVARGAMRVHFTSDSTIEKRGFGAAWLSLHHYSFDIDTTEIDASVTHEPRESMFMELWNRLVDAIR